ncbi:piggyBac transposable element-derived protein 4-like [Photinus pyralis]|uniref:piggyBac transposable element-derived protein 4-like n=1 Tax=Photinus pyralis TaxID=7054 RepID=UPI0012671760|nr:piggyBac transposable element-derived protein 4-like [Photinus pyralis]
MSNKRKLTEDQLREIANYDEAEWAGFISQDGGSGEESDNSSNSEVSDEIVDDENNPNQLLEDDEWTDIAEDPPTFPFSEQVGLKIDFTDCNIQILVDLFFSDEFLKLLVEQTNIYARQEIGKTRTRKSSRMLSWKDTDIIEMKNFLGLLLHMGPCSLPQISSYWSTSVFYNIPFWRQVMSRNRFQALLRFLHCSDNSIPSDDRLYKVRPILTHFNKVMRNNYTPGKNICIDESMMLWRGRLFFRQYIKNKKHKYGVKLYKLCESNGLVQKIKIYCGKSDIQDKNVGHSTGVVLHLMKDYLNKGHVLHMDNFYNSVRLTTLLSEMKTYLCGTLRSNRKGNPKVVIAEKLKRGELTWKRKGTVVVCKWKDKRDVLVISNKHKVDMELVRNRNGKTSLKPNIVSDYNNGMSGVDRSDQMLSYYSALRKTIRWHKKVALHIFEIYIHNAYIIYRNATSSKITSLQFREKVVESLLGENMPKPNKKPNPGSFHYLESLPPTEKKNRPSKPCRVCTANKKRRETRYFCPVCEEKPALCVENCFKAYHT